MSVNVFNTKVLIEDTNYSLLYVSFWRRDRLFTWSSEPLEGLAVCRTKEVTHFSDILRQCYWSGPGNRTLDLPFCSQVLYRLKYSCCA